ncbi:hypothetical protein [Chengkuizengella marina]|uniref:Uncharacterized protein n=1 Tax=Chengkuizengella marina TaxID=2507566 RepID=A0A6N9Q062_9BACL|nr:hypothetical protein [Chengkuizengella marina]NBI28647.1 hypothetical protein [Chengkuizengella marina]
MEENLKQKIECLLMGGFLTQKGGKGEFAFGLNLKTKKFYSIYKESVKEKKPKIIHEESDLPLDDIHENMEIL